MCNVDYGDPPTLFRTVERTSRKARRCDECGRGITVGERYENTFFVYEGDASTVVTCAHCLVARRWMKSECGGSLYGGGGEDGSLMDEMKQHADEYRTARFGLLRLYVGMRRSWQRWSGGGLLPLPPMPRTVHGADDGVAAALAQL